MSDNPQRPEKNPYISGSPHWQLFENARGLELQALAFSADAQRYQQKSQHCREQSEEFWRVLTILSKEK